MSLSPASTAPLAPVADPPRAAQPGSPPGTQPARAARAHDGQHRHGRSCWWDVAACGWHCAPAVAVPLDPQPDATAVLDPACPDVA